MRSRHSPIQILPGFCRVLAVGTACCLCAGCGLGALIGGAVAGALIALDQSSGSSGASLVPTVTLVEGPDRKATRKREDAVRIPICIRVIGDPEAVPKVQYRLVEESEWSPASRIVPPPEDLDAPECDLDRDMVFWWKAASDLDLKATAERVEVRAYLNEDCDLIEDCDLARESRPFWAGNSPPEVSLFHRNEGDQGTTLGLRVRDAEEDPLEILGLEYRVLGSEDWLHVCPSEESDWLHVCPSEESDCKICPDTRLEDIRDSVTIVSFLWNSKSAKGIGRRNTTVDIRLRAKDQFDLAPDDDDTALQLTLQNNSPPEVRVFGNPGERDQSFEIPISYRLVERDCFDPDQTNCGDNFQRVDVIVQYDPNGGEDFGEELGEAFDDPEFRRRVLDPDPASPEFDACQRLRNDHHIATPSSRRPGGPQIFGLRASDKGVDHFFLWDSALDLPAFATGIVTVRITPYDEAAGIGVIADIEVDNDLYPNEELLVALPVEGSVGSSVGGIAFGDLDGDRREDQVYSLTSEGKLVIRLSDGTESFLELPQGEDEVAPRPTELAIVDLNDDDLQDLVVLNRRCSIGGCKNIGALVIYYGVPKSEVFPAGIDDQNPPLILDTGQDARSLCVGDFNGDGRPDLAVSNHDDLTLGVFLGTASGRPDIMKTTRVGIAETEKPGQITCADFDQEDGRDEIVVRQREANVVKVFKWERTRGRLEEVRTIQVQSPTALATADFDGDDRPDLAVGTREWPYIHLFKNTSGENVISFSMICSQFELGGPSERLQVAPFESRPGEFLFVRLGDEISSTVELIRGLFADGDCVEAPSSFKSFRFTQPSNASNLRGSLAVRDTDGDGRADVFVGGSRGVRFLRAEGPGSIAAGPPQKLELPNVRALAFADLNCNSLSSIAAVSVDPVPGDVYKVSVFLQDSRAGFLGPPDWVSSPQPLTESDLYLAAGDRDLDGCADLIAVSRKDGIDVFVNEGSGFPEEPRRIEVRNNRAVPIAVGELDGDERGIDLLTLTETAARDSGLLSLRSLEFPDTAPEPEFLLTGVPRPSRLLVGDLDGNGRLDLVVTHRDVERGRDVLAIFLQVPDKRWPLNFMKESDPPELPAGLLLADTADLFDVNSDGADDLVFGGPGMPLAVYISTKYKTPGPLFPAMSTPPLDLPATINGVAVADFSGDGLPDVVLSSKSGQDAIVSVLFQKDGRFPSSPSRSFTVSGFSEGNVVRLSVADLTNDSRPELIVFGQPANGTWIWRPR